MARGRADIDEGAAGRTAAEAWRRVRVSDRVHRGRRGRRGVRHRRRGHVEATLGGCDVLCANVGVQQFGAIDRLTDDDWAWVLNVNVLGTVRTVRDVPALLPARTGLAADRADRLVERARAGRSPGGLPDEKFAVMGFGETLRVELADEGIGVTVLFPAA